MMTVVEPWWHEKRAERVPEHLGVVVAVVVDEPGRDHPSVGLDDPPGGAVQPSQLHDLAVGDADVAVEGGPAGAVDDAAVLDEQVVGHVAAPLRTGVGLGRVAANYIADHERDAAIRRASRSPARMASRSRLISISATCGLVHLGGHLVLTSGSNT